MKKIFKTIFKRGDVDMELDVTDINSVNNIVDKLKIENHMNSKEPIDIIKFAIDNGFLVQTMNMGAQSTGMLLVDEKNFITGTNAHKLIVVKKGLSEEQIRFIVAHELGHYYLSSGNRRIKQLAHREYTNLEKDDKELKADYFARAFLMPADSVSDFIRLLQTNGYGNDRSRIIRLVAALFNVTEKKAELRCKELNY